MVNRSRPHWLSVLQFTWAGLAALGLSGLTLLLLASAVTGGIRNGVLPVEGFAPALQALVTGLAVLLLVPSLVLAFARLLGYAIPPLPLGLHTAASGRILAAALAVLWAGAIAAIQRISGSGVFDWLLLPALYLLAIALPVGIVLLVGTAGLPGGSAQRRWGLFDAGLTATPLLVLIVEITGLVVVAVGLALYVYTQPGLAAELGRLAQRLSSTPQTTESLGRTLLPYLTQPGVILLGLGLFSVAVPLVEELLKPLPLWLLAGKRLTPAEGFVGGLLCGAGFALFESTSILGSMTGTDWGSLAIGRAGTDLLHMFNSGLVGWGMASAWQGKNYLRLAGAYLAAVLLHGLWNGLTLANVVSSLAGNSSGALPVTAGEGSLALYALDGLLVLIAIALIGMNLALNQEVRKNTVGVAAEHAGTSGG